MKTTRKRPTRSKRFKGDLCLHFIIYPHLSIHIHHTHTHTYQLHHYNCTDHTRDSSQLLFIISFICHHIDKLGLFSAALPLLLVSIAIIIRSSVSFGLAVCPSCLCDHLRFCLTLCPFLTTSILCVSVCALYLSFDCWSSALIE